MPTGDWEVTYSTASGKFCKTTELKHVNCLGGYEDKGGGCRENKSNTCGDISVEQSDVAGLANSRITVKVRDTDVAPELVLARKTTTRTLNSTEEPPGKFWLTVHDVPIGEWIVQYTSDGQVCKQLKELTTVECLDGYTQSGKKCVKDRQADVKAYVAGSIGGLLGCLTIGLLVQYAIKVSRCVLPCHFGSNIIG